MSLWDDDVDESAAAVQERKAASAPLAENGSLHAPDDESRNDAQPTSLASAAVDAAAAATTATTATTTSSSSSTAPSATAPAAAAPVVPLKRLLISGISWESTPEGLTLYFEQFGPVEGVDMVRDSFGTPRGIGYVRFGTPEAADACLRHGTHVVDGKYLQLKPAPLAMLPQPATAGATLNADGSRDAPGINVGRKVFVGGLSQETREAELRSLMSRHGQIESAVIMMDRATNRSRGFGFVTFSSHEEAENATRERRQILGDRAVEVKLYETGGTRAVAPRPMMVPRGPPQQWAAGGAPQMGAAPRPWGPRPPFMGGAPQPQQGRFRPYG